MDVAIGEGIPVLGARVDDGPVLDRAFGDCLVERSADGRRRLRVLLSKAAIKLTTQPSYQTVR